MTNTLTPEAIGLARRNCELAVLEGFHAVKHALRFGADILGMVTPDRTALASLAADLAPDLTDALSAADDIPADVFGAMSPHQIPTPVLAVARRPSTPLENVLAAPGRIVLLDRPRHLGNIGAVVRVAAAACAAGVLTTGDRDPWDAAALRGSAGLHFALPVIQIERIPPTDRPLVAIHPEGEAIATADIPLNAMLAFGSERRGLEPSLLDAARVRLAIPMQPGVSSLNLATSVAVVLYS